MDRPPRRRAAATPPAIRVAILSFLWPGLGQLAMGRPRTALTHAVPVGIAFGLAALSLGSGLQVAVIRLIDPSVAAIVLVGVVALGLWRVYSITEGFVGSGGRFGLQGRQGRAFAALVVITMLVHGTVGYYAWSFYHFGSQAFVGGRPSSTPLPSGATPGPNQSSPPTTPPSPDDRINILLTGIDSSATRTQALNDTMIVVSLDPRTRHVAMLSFPRDIAQFPLWNGRTFSAKINSFMTWADRHPADYSEGGMPSLMRELGFLLGVPIHYYAAVDLDGFVTMVDAAGGVTVNNPKAIDDPSYGGWTDGRVGFHLSAGEHTLDGPTALAFVRSRKGVGDNDFTRARRQQILLVALERQLSDPANLPRLPGLLDAAGRTIRTNFPPERLADMLALGQGIEDNAIRRIVLGPPYAIQPPPNTTGGVYILKLDMTRLAKLSVDLFGADSAYASPAPSPAASGSGDGRVPPP